MVGLGQGAARLGKLRGRRPPRLHVWRQPEGTAEHTWAEVSVQS